MSISAVVSYLPGKAKLGTHRSKANIMIMQDYDACMAQDSGKQLSSARASKRMLPSTWQVLTVATLLTLRIP